jgi:predicted phage terminase large subunit-like protein
LPTRTFICSTYCAGASNTPELKHAVRDQHALFCPSVVLVEDKASGTQLIQELVAEGLYAVTRYQPQSDKIIRMHAQTAMIENGFVHLPSAAPWLGGSRSICTK